MQMHRYSIIFFVQPIYVHDSFPGDKPSLRIVNSNQYVTDGGYTPNIENAKLFSSDDEAMRYIPETDETLYIIQHVYKHG